MLPRNRPSPLARAIVALNALTFIGLGIAFLIAPTEMAAIVDLEGTSNLARNDLRAVYGGLELGIGALLLAKLLDGELAPALRSLLFLFGAMILSRIFSLLADGMPAQPGTLLLGLEVAALSSAALGLRALGRRPRPPRS